MKSVCWCLILVLVITGFSYAAVNDDAIFVNDEDFVIYFNYEVFSGNIVPNMSSHRYDGIIVGQITQVQGRAAQFTTGSYIDLNGPSVSREDIPTDAITICAWIQCKNTGRHHAIFNARASDSTWIIHPEIRREGNYRFLLRAYGGSTIVDIRAGTVVWDKWVHYAATYNRKLGLAKLYLNGELITSSPTSFFNIAGDWDFGARVGYNIDNARPFTGLMDDFCIWKRALTQDEIKSLMGPFPLSPGDTSGDGTITAYDAALILQYVVGLIDQFPATSPIGQAAQKYATGEITVDELDRILQKWGYPSVFKLLGFENQLLQNYPNPFNPETWMPFKLAQDASVTISIYDTKGQLIRTISLGNRNAGIYTTKNKAAYWNGRDSLGEKVASGIYWYTLQAGEFRATRKMVILK